MQTGDDRREAQAAMLWQRDIFKEPCHSIACANTNMPIGNALPWRPKWMGQAAIAWTAALLPSLSWNPYSPGKVKQRDMYRYTHPATLGSSVARGQRHTIRCPRATHTSSRGFDVKEITRSNRSYNELLRCQVVALLELGDKGHQGPLLVDLGMENFA